MMLHTKKRYGYIITFSILLIWTVQFVRLKYIYPEPQIIVVNENEPLSVGNYLFTLDKFEWHSGKEADKYFPGYTLVLQNDGSDYPEDGFRFALVDLRIQKIGETINPYDLTNIVFESGAWHNQWDIILFDKLNPNTGLTLDLELNEEHTIRFPIVVVDVQFSKNDWKNIENRAFDIVLSCYPKKYVLRGNSQDAV